MRRGAQQRCGTHGRWCRKGRTLVATVQNPGCRLDQERDNSRDVGREHPNATDIKACAPPRDEDSIQDGGCNEDHAEAALKPSCRVGYPTISNQQPRFKAPPDPADTDNIARNTASTTSL